MTLSSVSWRTAAVLTFVLLASAVLALEASSAPARIDPYQYAGECLHLRDSRSGKYLAADIFGYVLKGPRSEAIPLRAQATALGRYLLYAPDNTMLGSGFFNALVPLTTPGPSADWRLTPAYATFSLTNVDTGLSLSAAWTGRLTQEREADARWSFEPAEGCAVFPELDVNVSGAAPAGQAGSVARGFLDMHVHLTAFDFLGGRIHCGRPWSPYGVTIALKDCADHEPNGEFAFVENLLSMGELTGTHSVAGWPDFDGWPRYDSLTHEGTYWKSVERMWRAGLRIMVSDLVENRALCEIYPLRQNACTDMASLKLQAQDMYDLQDYIDAQYKGPGKGFFRIVKSPAEARAVIAQGKLAVVMGVETSQPFDCLYQRGVEICSRERIDRGLKELWNLGVRSMFIVHKFDNAFGGTAMDEGTTGIIVNAGNKWMTGEWWEVEPCAGSDHDNTPGSLTPSVTGQLTSLPPAPPQIGGSSLYSNIVEAILDGPLPTYPGGSVCNVRGLTVYGEYLLNRMIDMGMIIETDHLSVKARARALEILEARRYSGVVSSHSWGDETSRRRTQKLGGVIGSHATTPPADFVNGWQAAKADQPVDYFFGIGFGTDTNGLSVQAHPWSGPGSITYPFTLLDGSVQIDQSRWRNRTWDLRRDGAAHYGLYADWLAFMRSLGGQNLLDDLANGAEAYLQMWERAGDKSRSSSYTAPAPTATAVPKPAPTSTATPGPGRRR